MKPILAIIIFPQFFYKSAAVNQSCNDTFPDQVVKVPRYLLVIIDDVAVLVRR